MYARVVRFEGGDPSLIDEQIADMKRQMDAGRSGDVPADAPEQVRTLMDTVTRFVELADRTSGASVGIAFCKTEEDVRRADAALDSMSPPQDIGKRTSVDIYEVVLDESFGQEVCELEAGGHNQPTSIVDSAKLLFAPIPVAVSG